MLGAAPGQTIIADSTTVVLYKLIRAALAAVTDPARTEIVLDTDNFPTDRYLVEGIAREEGLTLRWIDADPAAGVTVDQVTGGHRAGHRRRGPQPGGLPLGVPCRPPGDHRRRARRRCAGGVGPVPFRRVGGDCELDDAGVDFAAGCTYKYLNGGPGSPAFAYVNARHLPALKQPIWGWMGRKDAFEMAAGYEPAPGIRELPQRNAGHFRHARHARHAGPDRGSRDGGTPRKVPEADGLRRSNSTMRGWLRPASSWQHRGTRSSGGATSPWTTRPSGR